MYIVKDYFVLKLNKGFKLPKLSKKFISRLKVCDISEKIVVEPVK